jgi:hypothetical protein
VKRTVIARFLCGFIGLVFLLIGHWRYATRQNEKEAERFFQDAQCLQVGKATVDEVLELVASSHHRTNGGLHRCLLGASSCTVTVYFENYEHEAWLYRIHLASPMAFLGRFDIVDGKLQGRSLEMVRAEGGNLRTFISESQTESDWAYNPSRNPETRYLKTAVDHPGGYIGVRIAPDAPADIRKLAYFNFQCLSKLRGCNTVEEMLPILKQRDLR